MSGFHSLEQVFLTLRARWQSITLIAVLVLAVALAGTALVAPSYSAVATVILNTRSTDAIVDTGDGTTFNAYVTAELDLMMSDRVLLRVAADPRLVADPAARAHLATLGLGAAAPTARIASVLRRSLTVTNVKNTRTVTVRADATDPGFAALVANRVAAAYLATNLDLRVAPARANVNFFGQQKAKRAAELTAARARLDDYLRRSGMTGTENGADAYAAQLASLAAQRATSETQLAQSSAEVAVGRVAEGIATGAIVNPVIPRLRSEIAEQSAALADQLVTRGPNFPTVIQARERLVELRAQLDAETVRVGAGLRRRSASARDEASRLGALEAGTRATLSASAAGRSRLSSLQGDVERAKANYDAVTLRLAQVELASALEQPNAAVLSQAVPPPAPSGPSWSLSLVAGTLAGVVAGIGLALALELRRPRVRSWRDVERALGAPVLSDMVA